MDDYNNNIYAHSFYRTTADHPITKDRSIVLPENYPFIPTDMYKRNLTRKDLLLARKTQEEKVSPERYDDEVQSDAEEMMDKDYLFVKIRRLYHSTRPSDIIFIDNLKKMLNDKSHTVQMCGMGSPEPIIPLEDGDEKF
jgi:hypothetical protein